MSSSNGQSFVARITPNRFNAILDRAVPVPGPPGPAGPQGPQGPAGPQGPPGSITPWPVNVDAAGHSLSNVSQLSVQSGGITVQDSINITGQYLVNGVPVGQGSVQDPTTTLGDLLVRGASMVQRLPVGVNGMVLTADSAQMLGVGWEPLNIVGAGGVPSSRRINAGTGIGMDAGSGTVTTVDLSKDFTIFVQPDTVNQRLQVALAGALVGTRREINFLAGSNTSVSVVDNAVSNRVDVTIGAVSGGTPQPSIIAVDGVVAGTRAEINFISGSNIHIVGVDNSAAGRVDVTINSTAAGGGVASFNGRTGVVVPQAGDYSVSMINGALADVTTMKGDLIVRSVTAPTRFGVGTDGQILTADSSQPLGVRWAAASAAAVASVFGRTGAVVAQPGDYSASQVTNAVDTTVTYNNPNFIGSLAWNKITGAPNFVVDPTTTKGDILVRTTSGLTRVGVGAPGQVLTADSSQLAGVSWQTPAVTYVLPPATATTLGGVKIGANITVQADGTISVAAPGGGSQTPWTSNIDAANFSLNNLGALGIGGPAGTNPVTITNNTTTVPVIINAPATTGISGVSMQNDTSTGGTIAYYGTAYAANPALRNLLGITSASDIVFWAGGSERMRISAAGRVGIGVAAPAYPLDIAGDINITGTYRLNGLPIQNTFQSPWVTDIQGAGYRLLNTGNVGIGNSLPALPDVDAAVFLVVGSATAAPIGEIALCSNQTNTATWVGMLDFCNYNISGTEKRIAMIGSMTDGAINSGNLVFDTWSAGTAAECMRITSAGYVGIGNNGTPPFTGAGYTCLTVGPQTSSGYFAIVTACGNSTVTNAYMGSYAFANYAITASEKRIAELIGFADGTLNSGGFLFHNWQAGSLRESMRITSAGNVGIGTANPITKLHLYSTVNDGADIEVQTTGDGAFCKFQNNGGYKGIMGYASDASIDWVIGHYGMAGARGMNFSYGIGGSSVAEAMRITSAGYVGIGTAGPVVRLDVMGGNQPVAAPSTGGGAFRVASSAPNTANCILMGVDDSFPAGWIQSVTPGNAFRNLLLNPNGGPVGIGTTSPVSNLHVAKVGGGNCTVNVGDDSNSLSSSANGLKLYAWGDGNNYIDSKTQSMTLFRTGAGTEAGSARTWMTVTGSNGNVAFGVGSVMIGPANTGTQAGDLAIARNSSPTTAAMYFGNGGAFIWYTGSTWSFNPALSVPANITISYGSALPGADTPSTVYGTRPRINFGAGSAMVIYISDDATNNWVNVTYAYASDLRLKQNVIELTGGLPIINRLRPIEFEWNGSDCHEAGQRGVAVIAQELQQVLPGCVYPVRTQLKPDEELTEVLCYEPTEIMFHLVLAVQQLERRVKELEVRLN